MQGFLNEAAEQLYSRYGEQISSLRLIFPSRRSRIFFTEALSQIIEKPLWQPHWQSLDELFSQATPLKHGEQIRLITELYKIYSQYHNESFDKFYFWGEVLLSDFDMIDKYLIDAKMLFVNVSDIKELESDLSYLTDEQREIIVKFWTSLKSGDELTREKERFLKVWQSLWDIYRQFQERLNELGIAYTGMIQRSAVEHLKSGDEIFDESQHYIAIGFNALTECEKRLFTRLKNSGQIEFIWDADNYYTLNEQQEAGLFIRENIARYPSSFDISRDNFSKPKDIEVTACASNVLQCKYASKIIDELSKIGIIDKQTAIILTDENLLTPLLYALPKSAGAVNVTMGYPLKQSLAYSLIERLLSLQSQRRKGQNGATAFYHVDVVATLAHPYIDIADKELFKEIENKINDERLISVDSSVLRVTPLLNEIFSDCKSWQDLSQYLLRVISAVAQIPYDGDESSRRIEYLATLTEHITQLHNSLNECSIELSESIYISLLRRQLQAIRTPFEGEPLEGLQIMGILETRNLDFKNVIILSMNDDSFPGNKLTAPSYVPYNIRAAYGIPTPEHHEGVFAYYFYRVIARAERVHMLYCSHADEKTTGEPSRYIYQLDYESPFKIEYRDVGVDVNLYESRGIEVEKTGDIAKKLKRYIDKDNPQPISPSAINRYIACPLRFYFYHIARLRSSDPLSEDVDNSMFGNILHEAMQSIYSALPKSSDMATKIKDISRDKAYINHVVEQAIRSVCKIKERVKTSDFESELKLIQEIVVKYISDGVLYYDARHAEFEVAGTEKSISYTLELENSQQILLQGNLDRIDRLQSGAYRVVDYKTGSKHLDFKNFESLFEGKGEERKGHILQTLTYSMMLHYTEKVSVVPSLFYVRFMHDDAYSPLLVDKSKKDDGIARYEAVASEFEPYLKKTLAELVDCNMPFRQAEDREGTCAFCDFKEICNS